MFGLWYNEGRDVFYCNLFRCVGKEVWYFKICYFFIYLCNSFWILGIENDDRIVFFKIFIWINEVLIELDEFYINVFLFCIYIVG